MSTPGQIMTGIKAGIDSVADVGTVFKGRAVALGDAGQLRVTMAYENTLKEQTLRGWQMMLTGWRRVLLSTRTIQVFSSWQLESFQTFRPRATQALPEEADELEFDTRNNTVIIAFDSAPHKTLGGAVSSITDEGGDTGLQLVDRDIVSYGGGPCLMATFTLNCRHEETVP